MVETYSQLPTRNSVYDAMKTKNPDDYTWQVWQDAFTKSARFMPVQYPEWPEISSIISLALQQAQIQEKTPQEALDGKVRKQGRGSDAEAAVISYEAQGRRRRQCGAAWPVTLVTLRHDWRLYRAAAGGLAGGQPYRL